MNPSLMMALRNAAKLAVAGMHAPQARDILEQMLVEEQLIRCRGNKRLTARRLGIGRSTLLRMLDRVRILEAA